MFLTRDLREAFTTEPPLAPIKGGAEAKASRVLAAHTVADNLLGNGRRILARVGLHGSASFQAPSTSSESEDQTHPTNAAVRVVARAPDVRVTPGHFLSLSLLCVPSGITQRYVAEPGSWVADQVAGLISVRIDWTGPGGSEATIYSLVLPESDFPDGVEHPAAAGGWSELQRLDILLMTPPGAADDVDALRTWCDNGVTAAITVSYKGAPRIVDAVIQELPFGYAREPGVDTIYTTPLATGADGQAVPNYPAETPVEESIDVPAFGSLLLADVVDRQHHLLGPVLMHWTAFDEDSTAVTATDVPTVSTTSATFVNLVHQELAAWTDEGPGWTATAGGQAQQFRSSNSLRELRDLDACLPVRCWIYCYATVGGTATIQFQTERFSVASFSFTSPTPAWRRCTGHLRCGISPEDTSVVQVLGKVTGGQTLHISQILIEYADL